MYPYRTGRGGTITLGQADLMRSVLDSGVRCSDYLDRAERHARAVAATERTRQWRDAGPVRSRGKLPELAMQQLGAWLVAVGVRLQGVRAVGARGASVATLDGGTAAEPA